METPPHAPSRTRLFTVSPTPSLSSPSPISTVRPGTHTPYADGSGSSAAFAALYAASSISHASAVSPVSSSSIDAVFSPASHAAIVASAFAKSSCAVSQSLPSTSCVVNGRCHPLPRKPSFAQSVTTPPGTTASQPMSAIERTKIGIASHRLVTTLSILSENVALFLRASFFASALSITPAMNS